MVSAAFFTVSALLGWFISSKTVLNTRDKAEKQIAVYAFIGMVIFTIFAVGECDCREPQRINPYYGKNEHFFFCISF